MPKRNALKQYQRLDKTDKKISDAHRRVLEHRKTCIRQLIPSKTRGTFPVCLKTCKEYCVLCHHFCHSNNAHPGAKEETFEMNIPGDRASRGDGLTFTIKNSCFWYMHKEQFKEYCEQDDR
jgi:hypothetical protein